MISISKNIYIDTTDDLVNEYNNAYRSTVKMNPVDVKSSTYIENNDKDPKFEVVNHLKISKCKTFLLKVTLQIGLKKVLWLKKLKILCGGRM